MDSRSKDCGNDIMGDMVSETDKSLAGKLILVPPSRPETNPLLNILKMRGAENLSAFFLKLH